MPGNDRSYAWVFLHGLGDGPDSAQLLSIFLRRSGGHVRLFHLLAVEVVKRGDESRGRLANLQIPILDVAGAGCPATTEAGLGKVSVTPGVRDATSVASAVARGSARIARARAPPPHPVQPPAAPQLAESIG